MKIAVFIFLLLSSCAVQAMQHENAIKLREHAPIPSEEMGDLEEENLNRDLVVINLNRIEEDRLNREQEPDCVDCCTIL